RHWIQLPSIRYSRSVSLCPARGARRNSGKTSSLLEFLLRAPLGLGTTLRGAITRRPSPLRTGLSHVLLDSPDARRTGRAHRVFEKSAYFERVPLPAAASVGDGAIVRRGTRCLSRHRGREPAYCPTPSV